MLPENKLLFACTRKDFQPEHQELVFELCHQAEIDWNVICSTAIHHQVAPLVYYNLFKCQNLLSEIPTEIVTKLKHTFLSWDSFKRTQIQTIISTLVNFNKKSVDVMLLKGAALYFTVYNECHWYVLGDIDLILRNKREDVTNQEDGEDNRFFENLNINEWERFQHHDVNMNGTLPIDFEKVWEKAIETNFKGHKVFIMSSEDMLLAACVNSCRKRFFRLKSLLDISAIINYYQELNWEEFIRNAKAYNCQHIAYTSLLVTCLTVGCNLPDKVLDNLGINPVRAKIIRHLIEYLRNNVPLAFLLPSSGMTIFGRKINPSLILTIATLSWFHLFRKTRLALNLDSLENY